MAGGRVLEYIALDLETTGLLAGFDRVVEIGAVRFDGSGQEIGRYEQLVNPGRPMSPGAQAVHGISEQDLVDAPRASEVLPELLQFFGEPESAILLAHNAWFDAGFLGHELARAGRSAPGYAIVDTLPLARRTLPGLANHKLDTLASVLALSVGGAHRALADSVRVKELWLALGGPLLAPDALIAYPLCEGGDAPVVPIGWEPVADAIARGLRIRMEYGGGTRGSGPREITPRAFVRRGSLDYLVALCHFDAYEKSFRLDRVRWYEVIAELADPLALSGERRHDP
jgi:DNA polymerase III epsilon subunit family exonuclease